MIWFLRRLVAIVLQVKIIYVLHSYNSCRPSKDMPLMIVYMIILAKLFEVLYYHATVIIIFSFLPILRSEVCISPLIVPARIIICELYTQIQQDQFIFVCCSLLLLQFLVGILQFLILLDPILNIRTYLHWCHLSSEGCTDLLWLLALHFHFGYCYPVSFIFLVKACLSPIQAVLLLVIL